MQDNKRIKIMRTTAGALYGLYALYQVFVYLGFMQNASFFSLPLNTQVQFLLAMCAAVFAVWLLAGNSEDPGEKLRRGVMAVTVLAVLFELITYRGQAEMIDTALYMRQSSLEGKPIWPPVFIVIRLMLLILAAFFVSDSTAAKEMEADEEDAEESDEADEAEDAAEVAQDDAKAGKATEAE